MYAVGMFVVQKRVYDGFHMGLGDLGLYEQALWNTLHGSFFRISFHPERPTSSLFGEQACLLMVFVLPLYALWPSAYCLFFVQSAAIACAAIPLYLIAHKELSSRWEALGVAFVFLAHPCLHWANLNRFLYGFHADNLFPVLFFWAFYAYLRRWPLRFVVLLLLGMSARSAFGITAAALGAVIVLAEPTRRKEGCVMILLGAAWFVFATRVFIPLFRGGGNPWFFAGFRSVGELMADSSKWVDLSEAARSYALHMLVPVAFIPVLAPGFLCAGLPNAAANLLGRVVGYKVSGSFASWHVVPVLSLMYLAFVRGLGRLEVRVRLGERRRSVRVVVPLLAVVLSAFWSSPLPMVGRKTSLMYHVCARTRRVEEALKTIPDDASVSASYFIGAHLLRRREIYLFPHQLNRVDYVVADRQAHWPLTEKESHALDGVCSSPAFRVVFDRDGLVILKRKKDR